MPAAWYLPRLQALTYQIVVPSCKREPRLIQPFPLRILSAAPRLSASHLQAGSLPEARAQQNVDKRQFLTHGSHCYTQTSMKTEASVRPPFIRSPGPRTLVSGHFPQPCRVRDADECLSCCFEHAVGPFESFPPTSL